MGARKWTKEEEDLLREVWFQRGSLKVHAKKLGNRSNNAINLHGRSIGLPVRDELSFDRYSLIREQVSEAFEKGFTGTVDALAVEIGSCRREVLRRVREGHGTKYRISDWLRSKTFSNWIAVYTLGTEPDIPRPKAQTNQEKKKRYNEKRKIKAGKVNPFAALVSHVTGSEVIKMAPSKGRYERRVYSMEAA